MQSGQLDRQPASQYTGNVVNPEAVCARSPLGPVPSLERPIGRWCGVTGKATWVLTGRTTFRDCSPAPHPRGTLFRGNLHLSLRPCTTTSNSSHTASGSVCLVLFLVLLLSLSLFSFFILAEYVIILHLNSSRNKSVLESPPPTSSLSTRHIPWC